MSPPPFGQPFLPELVSDNMLWAPSQRRVSVSVHLGRWHCYFCLFLRILWSFNLKLFAIRKRQYIAAANIGDKRAELLTPIEDKVFPTVGTEKLYVDSVTEENIIEECPT